MELSTSTNILYERTDGSRIPVRESILLCADAGYRHLDFCFVDQISSKTKFLEKDWREYMLSIREYAENLGVVFSQTHSSLYDFCRGEDNFAWNMVLRSLEASYILGASWMVVHPSTMITDGEMSPKTKMKNVAFFRRLSDEAGHLGMGVAIENMWGVTKEGVRQYTVDPEEYFDLLEAVDAQNVGACWDAEHGSIEGIDQSAILHRLGSRLRAIHISDQTSRSDIHILPYMGLTKWKPILQALGEINFDGPFNFELQHYLLTLPLELAPAAIRFSREVGENMVKQVQSYRH